MSPGAIRRLRAAVAYVGGERGGEDGRGKGGRGRDWTAHTGACRCLIFWD